MIDARQEREAAEIFAGQVVGGWRRHGDEGVVCGGGISLSLSRDWTRRVDRPVNHDPRRKAGNRTAGADPQIARDDGRSGIGHRRGTQDHEVRRRTQEARQQDPVFTLLQPQCAPMPPGSARGGLG